MKMINEDKVVDVVYVHFSKTFDKVLHVKLIQNIKMHGINSNMVVWIQNWFTDRKQVVVVKVKYSG